MNWFSKIFSYDPSLDRYENEIDHGCSECFDNRFDSTNSSAQVSMEGTDQEITSIRDDGLSMICVPFIFAGIFCNVFSLWIWSSVKYRPLYMTIFLFKALGTADLFYLAFFFLARFYNHDSYFLYVFFSVICYGNRSAGLVITLMLAMVRLIRLYCPFTAPRLLSPFRLKLAVVLIEVFALSFQMLVSCRGLFLPLGLSRMFLRIILGRFVMLMASVLLQNVIMIVVFIKLWLISRRKTRAVCVLTNQKLNQGAKVWSSAPVRQVVVKSMPSSSPPSYTEMEMESEAGLQTPFIEDEAHGMQIETASTVRFKLPTDEPDHSTMGPESASQEAQRADQIEFEQCSGERSSIKSNSQASTSRNAADNLHCQPEASTSSSLAKKKLNGSKTPHPIPGLEEVPSRSTHSTLKPDSSTRSSAKRVVSFAATVLVAGEPVPFLIKRHQGEVFDWRTAFILLGMCLTTLLAYPVCSMVTIVLPLNIEPISYMCSVLTLVNSSFHIVFYLFINSFRAMVVTKVFSSSVDMSSFHSNDQKVG